MGPSYLGSEEVGNINVLLSSFHSVAKYNKFCMRRRDYFRLFHGLKLRNGHSRQIRETRTLLAQICRGESHFSRKWPLTSVGESGESAQHGSANVGEFGESAQHGSANVGKSAQHGSANVGTSAHNKIGRFKQK
jgi:hypothetical protein